MYVKYGTRNMPDLIQSDGLLEKGPHDQWCVIYFSKKFSSCSKSREADKHGNVILGSVGGQDGSVENINKEWLPVKCYEDCI